MQPRREEPQQINPVLLEIKDEDGDVIALIGKYDNSNLLPDGFWRVVKEDDEVEIMEEKRLPEEWKRQLRKWRALNGQVMAR